MAATAEMSVLDEIKQEREKHSRKMRQAENLIRSYIEEGKTAKDLTYADATFLAGLGFEGAKLNTEWRRLVNVVRDVLVVGDSASREKVDELCRDAELELLQQEPVKLAKINELRQEIDALRSNCQSLHKRRDDIDAALQRLCENCRPETREQHSFKLRQLNGTIRRELSDLETEIHHFEVLLATDEKNPLWLDGVQRFFPAGVELDTQWQRRRLTPAWAEKRKELEAALPAMKERARKLTDEYESKLAEINDLLKEYWN